MERRLVTRGERAGLELKLQSVFASADSEEIRESNGSGS